MKRLNPWLHFVLVGLPFLAACVIGFAAAGPPEAASLISGDARVSTSCYGYSGVLNLPLDGPSDIETDTIDLVACPAPSGMTVSSISVKVYFSTDFVTGGKQCSDYFAQLNVILSSSSIDDVLRVYDTNCCPEFPPSVGDTYTCIFEADSVLQRFGCT